MEVLYLILLILAAFCLLLASFSETNARGPRGQRLVLRFLPLGLFFWVLVPLIQIARGL